MALKEILEMQNAAQLAELSNYPYRKRISISGTGSVETDYIIKLNVHRGNQVGDLVGTDIFLNNRCKTDFSDLKFTDADGNVLPHYIQSFGNYELIYDDKSVGEFCYVYNGILYASNLLQYPNVLCKSKDNGQTWKTILGATTYLCGIDGWGNIYATHNNVLKRSANQGDTWESVLDMTSVSGMVIPITLGQDSLGNLFLGRYQAAKDVAIYKSVDKGETWTRVYTNTTQQHVHVLYIDPYTDYIYVGIDSQSDAPRIMVRSVDHGDTWETIWTGNEAQCTNILAFPGLRIMGGGDKGPSRGYALYKTNDDVTFTPLINTQDGIQGMAILGDYIYASTASHAGNIHSRILRFPVPIDSNYSNFEVQNIWYGPCDPADNFPGYNYMLVEQALINGATENQLIACRVQFADSKKYKGIRIFDGGSHYQACVLIKISNLPAAGTDIMCYAGNPSAVSSSTIYALPSVGLSLPTPLLYLPMNEGEGITVSDISGNNRNGTIHHTADKGNWNAYSGRFVGGPNCPLLTLPNGASYHFNAGDYIEIPTDATLEALTKKFSVVAWVRVPVGQTGDHHFLGKGVRNNGWVMEQHNGSFRFYAGNGATSDYWSAGSAINNGEWHMIGIVLKDTNPPTANLVFDGKIDPEVTYAQNIATDSGLKMRIGCDTSGNRPLIGDVSEPQIYPYELTKEQILQLWENSLVITKPAVVTTLL